MLAVVCVCVYVLGRISTASFHRIQIFHFQIEYFMFIFRLSELYTIKTTDKTIFQLDIYRVVFIRFVYTTEPFNNFFLSEKKMLIAKNL